MKKLSYMIVFVLITSIFLMGCEKKANQTELESTELKSLNLPLIDDVLSIEIAGGIEDIIITDKEVIDSIIQKIAEAKPTYKKSIQDFPTVLEHTRVDFISNGNISSIFIYAENSKWYIEQPYHTIYETDESMLKLLTND